MPVVMHFCDLSLKKSEKSKVRFSVVAPAFRTTFNLTLWQQRVFLCLKTVPGCDIGSIVAWEMLYFILNTGRLIPKHSIWSCLIFRKPSSHIPVMDNKWTVKDKLEIAEAVCTIVVSVMALWGTISAFNHDLFRKATHLIEHYHQEILAEEQSRTGKECPISAAISAQKSET